MTPKDKLFLFVKFLFMNFYYQMDKFVISAAKRCDQPGKKVLDIGVQASGYKRLFKNARYFSHDLNQNKEKTIDIVANLNKGMPSIKNKTFDYIFCIQVLEHLKKPQKVFEEFYRILKPNGLLFLSTNFFYQIHSAPYDYFRFTKYGLKYLGKSAGFSIESIKPQGEVFTTLSYLITTLPMRTFLKRKSFGYFLYIFLFSPVIIAINLLFSFLDIFDKKQEVAINYEAVFKKQNRSDSAKSE